MGVTSTYVYQAGYQTGDETMHCTVHRERRAGPLESRSERRTC